jgi:hypothetical protein
VRSLRPERALEANKKPAKRKAAKKTAKRK